MTAPSVPPVDLTADDPEAARAALAVQVTAATPATDHMLPSIDQVADLLELGRNERAIWNSYVNRGGTRREALRALIETFDERDTPIGGGGPMSEGLERAVREGSPIIDAICTRSRAVTAHIYTSIMWTLATVASVVPPCVVLPPIGLPGNPGKKGTLNLQFGIAANSGGGKGLSTGALGIRIMSGCMWAFPPSPVPAASGEAIAAEYVRIETDPDTKERVLAQYAWSGWYDYPEVDRLTAGTSRSNSTLSAESRSAWSGERIGTATKGSKLVVEPGKYRSIFSFSMQPGRAGALFEETDGGTLQRTVFVDASADPAHESCGTLTSSPLCKSTSRPSHLPKQTARRSCWNWTSRCR